MPIGTHEANEADAKHTHVYFGVLRFQFRNVFSVYVIHRTSFRLQIMLVIFNGK